MAKAFQDCIILFGDSLTQAQGPAINLHQSLSHAYERKLDVINRGFGGYNSNGGRALWDEIFARKEDAAMAQRVRMVTIWHGTNDAPIAPKRQANTLERYISNLNFFLSSLTSPSSPYAVADTPISIVLIACQPIVPRMIPAYNKPDTERWLVPERQRMYKDAALQVGREWKEREQSEEHNKTGWKVEVLDFWEAMVRDAEGEEDALLAKYFTDGVHLTPRGYEVLWKAMSEIILTKFKGRGLDFTDIDDLPQRAPWWPEVDWDHTEKLPSQLKYPSFR